MTEPPPVTYHLVAKHQWEALDSSADYVPESLAREGFIHNTDGARELAATANRYFRGRSEPFLVLVIDRARVKPTIRYDDPGRVYSHIYGPLNRDAILRVVPMPRTADGTFLPPVGEAY